MTILLYCYSTTVLSYIVKAKQEGKNFSVIVMETRPNYTGRLTVNVLLKLKIRTTLVTDIVGLALIPTTNLILIGADTIAKNGDIINKAGTSILAELANYYSIPIYCCTNHSKYSQENLDSKQRFQTRPMREILRKPPEDLIIFNPAYDVTKRKKITPLFTDKKKVVK